MVTKRLEELQKKVEQWSKDRGIIQNASLAVQTLKLMSEFGEIFESEIEFKNSQEKGIELLKDAIGDNIVVLININAIAKRDAGNKIGDISIRWCNADKQLPEVNVEPIVHLSVIYGDLCDAVAKKDYELVIKKINDSLRYLKAISNSVDSSLEECLELAYNEIKDRKGFLNSEGVFIKDTDPTYEKLYKEFKGE